MALAKMKTNNPDKVIEKLWEENNRLVMENEQLKIELKSLRWLYNAIKRAFKKHYEYVSEQIQKVKEGEDNE